MTSSVQVILANGETVNVIPSGLIFFPTFVTRKPIIPFSFSPVNGVPPYFFSLFSGLLPPGLCLSQTGTISGTPYNPHPLQSMPANYQSVIQFTDATSIKGYIQCNLSVVDRWIYVRVSLFVLFVIILCCLIICIPLVCM